MSTVPGLFLDRDVEADFAPGGFTRIGEGHYRRLNPNDALRDHMARVVAELNDARPGESIPIDDLAHLPPPPPPPTPIDRIAKLILALTYGEMVEFAGEIWACRGDGIEEQGLPTTLHRWAGTHK